MAFHITAKGEPAKCSATTRSCPLGGEHYDSMREAVEALEANPTLLERELKQVTHREETLDLLRASGMTDEAIAPLGEEFLQASREEQLAQIDAALKAPAGSYEDSHAYSYKGAKAALTPRPVQAEPTMPTITPDEMRAYKVARANKEQFAYVTAVLTTDEDSAGGHEWLTDWLREGDNRHSLAAGLGFTSAY